MRCRKKRSGACTKTKKIFGLFLRTGDVFFNESCRQGAPADELWVVELWWIELVFLVKPLDLVFVW